MVYQCIEFYFFLGGGGGGGGINRWNYSANFFIQSQ